jgi:hypothetical protein
MICTFFAGVVATFTIEIVVHALWMHTPGDLLVIAPGGFLTFILLAKGAENG